MNVAFDNTVFVSSSSATTVTSGAFTVGSSNNRAAGIGLSFNVNTVSGITASLGGVSGAAVASADSGTAQANRALIFGVVAPPSGSQTATANWTTASRVTLGVITASGVKQDTPLGHGTSNSGNSTTISVAVTSANGNLTMDTVSSTPSLSAPTQTMKWNTTATDFGAGSIGPGTGTTTHAWTGDSANPWASAGADFIAAGDNPTPASGLYVSP